MKRIKEGELVVAKTLVIFFAFMLNTSFAQTGASKVPEKNIDIVLGLDKIEKYDFAVDRKVEIGNSSFLDYTLVPSKREIILKGLKPGKTTVSLRNTVGDLKMVYVVNITANDLSNIVQELREPKMLGDVEGIDIGIAGDNVYVGGKIVVPGDIGRVVVILEKDKYKDVLRLVELSPHTQRVIARKMQEEIQKNQLRDVTVRVINGLFWLEGIVTSRGDRDKAEAISAAYIPDRLESLARRTDSVQRAARSIIQNFIQVNPKQQPPPIPKLIKVTTQFVELTKDYNKIFGFKWSPLLNSGGGSLSFGKTGSGQVSTKSSNTLSGTISNLFPKLASAKNAGFARIIQSGVIIVKNNFAANINKSLQKNTAVGNGETQRVVTTTGGFDLNVTPKILAEEKIELNIGLNVSTSQGDASSPEQLNNKIKTSVVVKSKESAVIGGIVINRTNTDFDRNPPFADEEAGDGASPLFSFLRSKTYTTNRSQFAVFVTPEILESASAGTQEIKSKFRKRRR